MKKVLIIYAKSTGEIFNRRSALGSYIFCLCNLLEERKMEVFINGISYQKLKLQSEITPSPVTSSGSMARRLPSFIKDLIKDMLVFKKMKTLVRTISESGNYDCILEFYNYASNIGAQLSASKKIPLVLVYDAPVLEEHIFFHGPKVFFKRKIQKLEKESVLAAHSIIAYSNAVKDHLNRLAEKKLNVSLHQNVDFTRFDFLEKKFPEKNFKIGFIGSFLKWHRIDLLIKAFEQLRKENYPVELILIGHGMEFDAIKNIVDHSAYKNYISMPGFMDGQELLEMKQQLHIGIMPGSNWYGAPNKIFEYGAAKMAVIAPATPTIVDLFKDNQEILLFRQDDLDDLFQKMKLLCDHPEICNKLAETLQKKIRETYSAKNTADFYSGILNNAMSN